MKKNFTVNISGVIFHIDDDAYEKLNRYLNRIKLHFKDTEGSKEIITDIENRIAEMLQNKTGDSKTVITIEDIEDVISQLGEPTDFSDEEEPKTEHTYQSRPKRLFRDPDNKVLGGVAAGMGAYFNADPLWFRLGFIALTLFSAGFMLFFYFILWFAIPEARTTAEKLEMRGEEVNIDNIKRFKEEMNDLKDRFENFADEAKETFRKKKGESQNVFEQIGYLILMIIKYTFKFVLYVVGFSLVIAGLAMLIALFVPGMGFFDISISNGFLFSDFIYAITGGDADAMMTQLTILLIFGIPLIMLVYGGIRVLFGIRSSKTVALIALALWLVGIGMGVFYSFKIGKNFSDRATQTERTLVAPEKQKMLTIGLSDNIPAMEDEMYEGIEIDRCTFTKINGKTVIYGNPEIEFVQNSTDSIEVMVYNFSKGKSNNEAYSRAKGIVYNFEHTDSTLILDKYFNCGEQDVFRDQKVKVVIKVPEGQSFKLEQEMEEILFSIENFDDIFGTDYINTPLEMKDHGIETK